MSGENYINHIALVLDASGSMANRAKDVINVTDSQVAYLADRSNDLDQETRATVYTFDSTVACVYYDKDVLRLPSIADRYRAWGRTALIDSVIQSQNDLAATAQLYGDHAFLTYILTDGEENASKQRQSTLTKLLESQPDNWTVACLVPDERARNQAIKYGFSPGNVEVWDTKSSFGVTEVGSTIRQATENFMTGRSSGIRGTKSLFSTGIENVNPATVQATLTPVPAAYYSIYPVFTHDPLTIRDFIEAKTGQYYRTGKAFYEFGKTETIQPNKEVAVLEIDTGKIYRGPAARDLIGLTNVSMRGKPKDNPLYKIFVQSTSVNRRLVPGTQVLVVN